MNPIQELHAYLRQYHPGVKSEVTPPLRPDGYWSLDVDLAKTGITAEWRDGTDIKMGTVVGVANAFSGPGEKQGSLADAKARISHLLKADEMKVPALV